MGREFSSDAAILGSFFDSVMSSRTVECSSSPDWIATPPTGWVRQQRIFTSYTIEREHLAAFSAQFSESHRRNVNHGEAAKPRILPISEVDDVRNLLSGWAGQRRNSRLVLNHRSGAILVREFRGTGALVWHTAWIGARPVSSVIFLRHGSRAVYVDGATDRDPEYRGVGHFLFADTLSVLGDDGVDTVDLGSGPGGRGDSGLERFKRGWGAKPVEHTEGMYRRRWYGAMRGLIRPGG
jgi:hypothetical protein